MQDQLSFLIKQKSEAEVRLGQASTVLSAVKAKILTSADTNKGADDFDLQVSPNGTVIALTEKD